MLLLPFEKLPQEFQNADVKRYYDVLCHKKASLFFKRVMDIFFALLFIIILSIPMFIIALCIKFTSDGPVLYKQQRVTTYGKVFKIWKFRTMTVGADKASLITTKNDNRITKVGGVLRKFRLDELPQIFNVLSGKMTIVGARPEVMKYVSQYSPVMYATLLMPAGITSLASVKYKDEDKIIGEVSDPAKIDETYMTVVLPDKMKFNLEYIKEFSFFHDIRIMFHTAIQVFLK